MPGRCVAPLAPPCRGCGDSRAASSRLASHTQRSSSPALRLEACVSLAAVSETPGAGNPVPNRSWNLARFPSKPRSGSEAGRRRWLEKVHSHQGPRFGVGAGAEPHSTDHGEGPRSLPRNTGREPLQEAWDGEGEKGARHRLAHNPG